MSSFQKTNVTEVEAMTKKGHGLAFDADKHVDDGNLEDALKFYTLAVESLMLASQMDKRPAYKKILQQDTEKIMNKAERIKSEVRGEPVPVQPVEAERKQGKKAKKADDGAPVPPPASEFSDIVVTEKPNVTFESIAGLNEAKKVINEVIVLPLRLPAMFRNIRPWKGILLYGPPGTGKTQLARAIATETKSMFISISCSDILSKWVGDSEKKLKEVFTFANKNKPAIIFIDEIDAMLGQPTENASESSIKVKNEFLQQADGLRTSTTDSSILLLGATNNPEMLGDNVLRRFEKRIHIPLPDVEARVTMIELGLKDVQHTLTADDIRKLAAGMEGYSGADIFIVINDAKYEGVRKYTDATFFVVDAQTGKYIPCEEGAAGAVQKTWKDMTNDDVTSLPLSAEDMACSLAKNKPSTNPEKNKKYDEFTEKYGIKS